MPPKHLFSLFRLMGFLSACIILVGCQQAPALPTPTVFSPTPRPTLRPTFTPEPSLYTSWKGIQPGQTTAEQTQTRLGQPDRIAETPPFLIYSYDDHAEWGWELVEVWLEQVNEQWLVSAIFFSVKTFERGVSVVPSKVAPLLHEYGQPTKVTWSNFASSRYWIWVEVGVSIEVSSQLRGVSGSGWNKAQYSELLLFKPMELEQFLQTDWPWPFSVSGFARQNWFTGEYGDLIDTLPEDPYDWTTMPTPPVK